MPSSFHWARLAGYQNCKGCARYRDSERDVRRQALREGAGVRKGETEMAVIQRVLCFLVVGLMSLAAPAVAQGLTFDKVFSPNNIGAGSSATLTFTISSAESTPTTDLAFTDNLPAGLVIADNAASTTCVGADLSAPDGGSSLTFSNGLLGVGETCTVTATVTAASAGTYTNVSGDLTSSAGNSGPATDDLTVVTTRPGFSKSLSPASVNFNQITTVTYTIDNSANAAGIGNLDFSETFPSGVTIASPSNAATTCGNTALPTVVAAPVGGSTITLDSDGFAPTFPAIAAGATCTVTVDIVAAVTGSIPLVSDALLADFTSVGISAATLDVTAEALNIAKDFLTNPANAGTSTTLRFTIRNRDRFGAASSVAFTDDLTFLPGLTFDSVVSNSCGGTLTGVGTSNIGFSGGSIASGAQCQIDVSLGVPAGAAGGTYSNVTSTVTGVIGGDTVVGNSASRDLVVPSGGGAPILSLDILEAGTLAANPTPSPGEDIVFRFTIENGSSSSTATDVAARLQLAPPLGLPLSIAFPATPCGGASTVTLSGPFDGPQFVQLSSGELAPGGNCTFDVTVTLANDISGGTYDFNPDDPTATVNAATVTGTATGDSVTVGGGVNLSFSQFFSGAVAPGDTVDLTFEIINTVESGAVTDVGFTTALGAALTGLTV